MNRPRTITFFLGLLLLGPGPIDAHASADGEKEKQYIFDQVKAANEDLNTLQAEMTQRKISSFMADETIATSSFYYRKPGMYRLKPKKRDQNDYIVKRDQVWIVNHKTKDIMVTSDRNANFTKYLVGFGNSVDQIDNVFEVKVDSRVRLSGFGSYKITLIPRESSDLHDKIEVITILLRDDLWLPYKADITEIDGDQTIWEFSNFKLNQAISESTFEQQVPNGYQKRSINP